MKRSIVWLLTAALLITLVGCTAEPQTGNDSATTTESAAETTTTTAETEPTKTTETTKVTEAVTETTSTTKAPTSEKATTTTTTESTGTTKATEETGKETEETGKATEAVTETTSTTEAPTSEKTTTTTTTRTTTTTTESTGTTTKATEKTSKVTEKTSKKTTTTTAGLTTDAPLTLTLEKYHGEGHLYKDATVPETNYSLKLTANVDLVNLRLISIDPETATPDASLRTLTPLKKGESQYVLTYVNDANPNRGVVCVDKQGNTYYYAFVYSGNSGRVYLGLLKVTH